MIGMMMVRCRKLLRSGCACASTCLERMESKTHLESSCYLQAILIYNVRSTGQQLCGLIFHFLVTKGMVTKRMVTTRMVTKGNEMYGNVPAVV